MSEGKGLLYVFTGDGKGKTSAALGVAMRAVGQGKRVAMIQWYKERRWTIGEHVLPKILKKPLFEIYPMGQGFYKLPTDHASSEEHRRAAHEALHLAKESLTEHNGRTVDRLTGQKKFNHSTISTKGRSPFGRQPFSPLFLLILDEVINAVNDHLLALPDLLALLELRGSTHLILTGRSAPKKLIDIADLVTEMKNVKHPYEKGLKAVQGLDF